jgi:hypothetical protein
MDIYSHEGTEGILDIHKARIELAKTGGMTEAGRRSAVAEISAAALLDIAYSLRPIGMEALAAMTDDMRATVTDARAEAIVEPEGDVFLKVGDIVAVEGHAETAIILGFGSSEGATYAEIVFESGADVRVWTSLLSLVDSPDEDAEAEAAAEATVDALRALNAEADGEPDLDEDEERALDEAAASAPIVTDGEEADVDDDFEDVAPDIDPEHEVDPLGGSSPLDALKASQAARKPAKKKGGKK